MKLTVVLPTLFSAIFIGCILIMLGACGSGGGGDGDDNGNKDNSAPVAKAGDDQYVSTGETVILDGSGSTDSDGDPLTYEWSFTEKPSGSAAVLSDSTVPKPSFTADLDGTYAVSLRVNDGKTDSPADTVNITSCRNNVFSSNKAFKTTGGFTISGSLILPGPASGNEWYIIIDDNNDGSDGWTASANGKITGNINDTWEYSISGVPAGTYYIYAQMDTASNSVCGFDPEWEDGDYVATTQTISNEKIKVTGDLAVNCDLKIYPSVGGCRTVSGDELYRVTGTLTLPGPASDKKWYVIIDDDHDGGNGHAGTDNGIVSGGKGDTWNYSISNIPPGDYYIYTAVELTSTWLWEDGDYVATSDATPARKIEVTRDKSVNCDLEISPSVGGCVSGSGAAPSAQEGQFIDSPVEGLRYLTDTQSGVTDSDGTFKYQEGEIVTFYIEDIVLGESSGRQTINPVDLVEGAADEMDSTVTNICRFVQSLDMDGDPDNGINISAGIRDVVAGRSVDFSQSETDFENDPETQDLFNALKALGFPNTFVSAYQAQSHLRHTLGTVGSRPDFTGAERTKKCNTPYGNCYQSFAGVDIINKGDSGEVFVSVSAPAIAETSVVFFMDHGETLTVWFQNPPLSCSYDLTFETHRALNGDVSEGPFTVQRQNNDNAPACP